MSNKITISDLEKHFVKRADQGASVDSIFAEFATMIGAKFTKFKYRSPDAYGVLVDNEMWINLYYSPQRGVFGFQSLYLDGTLQAALSLQYSDSSIVDVILRLATNIGKFSLDNNDDNYSDNSYDSENSDSESY